MYVASLTFDDDVVVIDNFNQATANNDFWLIQYINSDSGC